jgi:hypothetical protein
MGNDGWIFLGIILYVGIGAWASRRVALDMDARGKAGWAYGMATLLLPPLGLALWLLDRDRPPVRSGWKPELGTATDLLFFIALLVTFPWGLLIWLLMNRRARPDNR